VEVVAASAVASAGVEEAASADLAEAADSAVVVVDRVGEILIEAS
jgi:hypothetical protein